MAGIQEVYDLVVKGKAKVIAGAVQEALDAGCDLNCGNTYLRILQAYEQGLVTEEQITQAAERLMTTRFMLGMFDPDNEYNKIPYEVVECREHLETAEEMALGAVRVLGTSLAVSVTGIAGPGGGTPEKPVGTVWLAVASKDGQFVCRHEQFRGSRDEIRAQTVASALDLLLFAVESIRNPQSFSIE